MNANRLSYSWAALCPPAQMYSIVMSAFVLFNLYRGTYRYAIRHAVALVLGAAMLWTLCAAKLDFAAYALLLLPVLFFVFFLAILFYDQSLLSITHSYARECEQECQEESCSERRRCA